MTMVDPLAVKGQGYYANPRDDVVAKIPRPLGRVLDVGCGSGGVGRTLRAAGAGRLEGVEVNAQAAEQAREVFDAVHVGTVEDVLATGDLEGPFDTFVLYDVLEHLVDPWEVLRSLHQVAAPGARVHVSVPNARHFSLLVDLVLRGTFGYTEWGHRDATHLRWFTRRDIEAALASTGWRVQEASPGRDGPQPGRRSPHVRAAARVHRAPVACPRDPLTPAGARASSCCAATTPTSGTCGRGSGCATSSPSRRWSPARTCTRWRAWTSTSCRCARRATRSRAGGRRAPRRT